MARPITVSGVNDPGFVADREYEIAREHLPEAFVRMRMQGADRP
jgi:hypothetical protein